MSRKRKASLKKRAKEMNEVKLRAKLARAATTESTLEGAVTQKSVRVKMVRRTGFGNRKWSGRTDLRRPNLVRPD